MDRTVAWMDQCKEYSALSGCEKFLLQVRGGGHYTFSDICTLDLGRLAAELDFGPAEEALQDGCSPDNLEWATAIALVNHYTTAFFNLHLRGSPGSAKYLDPALKGHPFEHGILYRGDEYGPDFCSH